MKGMDRSGAEEALYCLCHHIAMGMDTASTAEIFVNNRIDFTLVLDDETSDALGKELEMDLGWGPFNIGRFMKDGCHRTIMELDEVA